MYLDPNNIQDLKKVICMLNDASDQALCVQRWFDNRADENTANADAAASTLAHSIWNACDALITFLEINADYER